MSDAPERMWVWPGSKRGWYAAESSSEVNLGLMPPESDQQQQYVRAALYEVLERELAISRGFVLGMKRNIHYYLKDK